LDPRSVRGRVENSESKNKKRPVSSLKFDSISHGWMTYTSHVVQEAHPIKNALYHVDQFLGFAGSLRALKVTSNSGGYGVISIPDRKEQGTASCSSTAGDNTRRAVFLLSANHYLYFFDGRHKMVLHLWEISCKAGSGDLYIYKTPVRTIKLGPFRLFRFP
jgi:hypothetical protein